MLLERIKFAFFNLIVWLVRWLVGWWVGVLDELALASGAYWRDGGVCRVYDVEVQRRVSEVTDPPAVEGVAEDEVGVGLVLPEMGAGREVDDLGGFGVRERLLARGLVHAIGFFGASPADNDRPPNWELFQRSGVARRLWAGVCARAWACVRVCE